MKRLAENGKREMGNPQLEIGQASGSQQLMVTLMSWQLNQS